MAYILPNSNIKSERPKRKHKWEDVGYQPTAPIAMGQLCALTTVAGGRPTAAPATAGAKCFPALEAVTQADINSGKWVTLRLSGEAPVVTAEAIAGGTEVMSDANGHAVPLVRDAGNYCAGFLQSGSNAPNHRVALEIESYYGG